MSIFEFSDSFLYLVSSLNRGRFCIHQSEIVLPVHHGGSALSRDPAFTKIVLSRRKAWSSRSRSTQQFHVLPSLTGKQWFLLQYLRSVTAHFRSCQDGAAGDSGGGSRVSVSWERSGDCRHAESPAKKWWVSKASSGKATRVEASHSAHS